MTTKKCTKCNNIKLISEYHKEPKGALGVKSKCKNCHEALKKKYYHENIEKIREKRRIYASSESQRTYRKNYRNDNRENILTKEKQYREVNKVKITVKRQEKKQKRGSPWREESFKAKMREYYNARWRSDIAYRLKCCLRSRLRQTLRAGEKSCSSSELVGCSPQDLKQYLTNLFKPGMSWDNYGSKGWSVDHILPCKMFNLSLASEQKKCFHYTNLQPLWTCDNSKKGGTFDVADDCLSSIYLLFE